MLNRRLKTIVAKPPTSNKKFYQDTEDVLKSLGRKQQHEKEHHRRLVFEEEEEEEGREKTLSSSSSFSETRRKTVALQNGDVYEGKWDETSNLPVADETSTYTWKNGDTFTGNCTQILQGEKRTDSGIITYKDDGTVYEYYRKGYGKLVRADGSIYIGNFNERGEFSGLGKFTSAANKTTKKHDDSSPPHDMYAQHEGLYREGKPNGPGQFRFANGDMYQGEFVDGFFHGWGTIVFSETGDRYDGEFSRGAFNENGVYTWKNGNCYVGKWKNNKMHGPGAFSDGEEVFVLCEYINGKRVREEKKGELPEALKQHRKRMQDSMKQHNAQSMKLQSSSSMKISKMYKEFGEANLFKKMFSSRSQSVRRVKAGGQTIFKGHRSYELMTQLQLGVVWSISHKKKITTSLTAEDNMNNIDENDTTNDDNKPLVVTDFDMYVKVQFPRIGSEITPPHSSSDFKWKLYSPNVFKSLRKFWGVDESEFMLSICGEQALKEMNSAGKSGSIFFSSTDDRYIIKTMRKVEMKALLKMLPKYYRHIQENEDSLLTKFFGVFSVKPNQGKKVRFIVMANLFCDSLEIHDTYDLKGSTLGRSTSPEIRMKAKSLGSTTESGVILKDLDLGFKFRLEKSKRDLFIRQVSLDLKLLEELNIMDYSLLVGVHYTNPKNRKSKTGSMILDSQLSSGGADIETPQNMSFTELDVDHDEDILMSVKKRNNERTSFESSEMNDIDDDESNSHSKRGEYAWALNIYKQLSKNFGAFETVAATSTKPLVFKYINHGGRRNEEKRPWKGADEQIAQVVGDHVTQFSSNNLPKQLAAVCVPGRSFKSLSEKDIKVLHVEPRVRDAILNVGIIDILQMYSAPKRLERGFKGAVYRATSISVAAPKSYAKRFKDFMRNIFE